VLESRRDHTRARAREASLVWGGARCFPVYCSWSMPPVCGQGRWITLNKHIHTAVVIPLLLPSETEVGGTLALLQSVLASGHRFREILSYCFVVLFPVGGWGIQAPKASRGWGTRLVRGLVGAPSSGFCVLLGSFREGAREGNREGGRQRERERDWTRKK